MTEADKLVEDCARAIMVESVCGCTLGDERVFCNDARLPDDIRSDCVCFTIARAAIAVAVERCANVCGDMRQDRYDAPWNNALKLASARILSLFPHAKEGV